MLLLLSLCFRILALSSIFAQFEVAPNKNLRGRATNSDQAWIISVSFIKKCVEIILHSRLRMQIVDGDVMTPWASKQNFYFRKKNMLTIYFFCSRCFIKQKYHWRTVINLILITFSDDDVRAKRVSHCLQFWPQGYWGCNPFDLDFWIYAWTRRGHRNSVPLIIKSF